jgi:hypothetical protein
VNNEAVYHAGYEEAAFLKDKQGEVHLRGVVVQNAGVPSTSPIIAVLPEGYRPPRRQIFAVYGGAPDGASRVDILPDGTLTWTLGSPNAENDYTTLSGISFFAG